MISGCRYEWMNNGLLSTTTQRVAPTRWGKLFDHFPYMNLYVSQKHLQCQEHSGSMKKKKAKVGCMS